MSPGYNCTGVSMNNAFWTRCPFIDHGPILPEKKRSLHVINITRKCI